MKIRCQTTDPCALWVSAPLIRVAGHDTPGRGAHVTRYTHLTLSGDLGSGKTTVARRLQALLGMEFCSTGELHRQIAAELGQSALEANRTAEVDASIDARIDGRTIELGRGETPFIFDSRMAWSMVDDAFKVHLLADPREAARRVIVREATAVESYRDVHHAAEGLKERSSVERRRFKAKYNVDILALAQYDLVVDTTGVAPDDVVELIRCEYVKGRVERAKLWINPGRVLDLSEQRLPAALDDYVRNVAGRATPGRLNVFYAMPYFFVLRTEDARVLDQVRSNGASLVPATLLSDNIDAKADGIYLKRALTDVHQDVFDGSDVGATRAG